MGHTLSVPRPVEQNAPDDCTRGSSVTIHEEEQHATHIRMLQLQASVNDCQQKLKIQHRQVSNLTAEILSHSHAVRVQKEDIEQMHVLLQGICGRLGTVEEENIQLSQLLAQKELTPSLKRKFEDEEPSASPCKSPFLWPIIHDRVDQPDLPSFKITNGSTSVNCKEEPRNEDYPIHIPGSPTHQVFKFESPIKQTHITSGGRTSAVHLDNVIIIESSDSEEHQVKRRVTTHKAHSHKMSTLQAVEDSRYDQLLKSLEQSAGGYLLPPSSFTQLN